MIQIHERARQGRLRAKICQEIRQQEERERLAANRGAPTLDPDIAATRIQKVSCRSTNVCLKFWQYNSVLNVNTWANDLDTLCSHFISDLERIFTEKKYQVGERRWNDVYWHGKNIWSWQNRSIHGCKCWAFSCTHVCCLCRYRHQIRATQNTLHRRSLRQQKQTVE